MVIDVCCVLLLRVGAMCNCVSFVVCCVLRLTSYCVVVCCCVVLCLCIVCCCVFLVAFLFVRS